MQYASDSYQLVHAHDEHWWHSSLTRSHSPHIPWLNYYWNCCFHIRSNSIRPSFNSHFLSLYNVPRDLYPVCLPSNRISLHSSTCLQWLLVICWRDGHFAQTFFLTISTIISCIQKYGYPSTGPWLVVTLRILFWMYVAITFTTAVLRMYLCEIVFPVWYSDWVMRYVSGAGQHFYSRNLSCDSVSCLK